MSIYDDDHEVGAKRHWGDVTTPRRVPKVAEQEQTSIVRRSSFVPALPQEKPIPAQVGDPYAPHAGLLDEVRNIHTSDPISRGKALFLKTVGISLFLWGLTIAALALTDSLSFFLWLLWASLEGSVCFIVLAVLDWRETPSAIRWRLTEGFLHLMEREQTARLIKMYGVDPKELD